MSETMSTEEITEGDKPVSSEEDVKFPPFPEPTDDDFDEDISEEERQFYKEQFSDLNVIKSARLHCTACDRHLGSSIRNEGRMRAHPMLRTLVCHTCHTFYNSGEFEKGDDGSELYCRWCGQGGQVYCCSNCPHVFCAKCIKRNMGLPKIKEIENIDDWKCFKCNPRCLWDLRALCWALLRYCDLKNKMLYQTQDPVLRELYIKNSAVDHSECCKGKTRKKEKKKEIDNLINKASPPVKLASTIQVKKFASINADDSLNSPKKDKKQPVKRPASPKYKPIIMKTPIAIANAPPMQPVLKKYRPSNPTVINPVKINNDKRIQTFRIRPKPMASIGILSNFNGFNNANNSFGGIPNSMMVNFNDNLNLSLDSLTQGLDMSAVAHMTDADKNDDVVCTPDLPLEPLCEVTEDNDDDVECITPGPSNISRPVMKNPPPLVHRSGAVINNTNDPQYDNIIQMTENDVTINEATGGLKFRVDPQTLSSNKMYRLPDGRIFAINVNPNMPGGYSATIVALADSNKVPSKGATYAAKLSAVSQNPSPAPSKKRQNPPRPSKQNPRRSRDRHSETSRECDLEVPVEWFRYNLLDAIDCLEYSLVRLNKLKREATTMHLRTRNIDEMRVIHRNLERLLNTSSNRFVEIRQNMNKEFKQYLIQKKRIMTVNQDDDDDDVEILNDDNEGPIFIDENSLDSHLENQEVDLTAATGSGEHNHSAENKDIINVNENARSDNDVTLTCTDSFGYLRQQLEKQIISGGNVDNESIDRHVDDKEKRVETQEDRDPVDSHKNSNEINGDVSSENNRYGENDGNDQNGKKHSLNKGNNEEEIKTEDDKLYNKDKSIEENNMKTKINLLKDTDGEQDCGNAQESEISEEMIESLLKDESMESNVETANSSNTNKMDISEN